MSIDAEFLRRIESSYPGPRLRDRPRTASTTTARPSIKYGRGAVLTIDLTNRCNMMCNPCFMDANQVGYVHELTLEEIQKILDDAISIKPRRQLSVQFSGGEPTLSPHFLRRRPLRAQVGYFSVQCATNGIRFAQDAGLREARPARRACASPTCSSTASATRPTRTARSATSSTSSCARSRTCTPRGIDVTLVVTIVNGINNEQVGADRPVRHREHRQGHRASRSSPSPSRAATRTSTTRPARSSATRSPTSPTT